MHEEDVDADEATVRPANDVSADDEEHRYGAQPLDVRSKGEASGSSAVCGPRRTGRRLLSAAHLRHRFAHAADCSRVAARLGREVATI